jgi:hypothetical protein
MRLWSFAGFLGAAACGLVALGGCGKGRSVGPCVPVQGKVTLGGQPLAGGVVELIPLEGGPNLPRPEGRIDAQGGYSLTTAGKGGAPVGRYRVVVTTSGEDKKQESQFNSVYSHPENSPLILPVTEAAAPGAYDLRLTPLPPRPRR